jgi:hypothetical protein
MDWLNYRSGALFAENVSLQSIADQFGTPTFVYSRASIVGAFREFKEAAAGRDILICYALKANPNLAVIDFLARERAQALTSSPAASCSACLRWAARLKRSSFQASVNHLKKWYWRSTPE